MCSRGDIFIAIEYAAIAVAVCFRFIFLFLSLQNTHYVICIININI